MVLMEVRLVCLHSKCVTLGFFNENSVANIISWYKHIELGMDPDNFKEYLIFVLYTSGTAGWIFAIDRGGLYMCYTRDMSPVELPKHFMHVHGVVAVSTVAQNMARYTKHEV